ncbi:MAG TPA: DUF1491 family protein [Paracoccaceae bacterium]|nr:DUF1491 family protein [Paracoccaceae bacterium]
MARLASGIWVSAYLMRLQAQGVFAHIVHRGEATAGAVAVKIATMDGQASVFVRMLDGEGNRVWAPLVEHGPEPEADAAIARQRRYDRDLWVVEVEDPRGRHLLDEPGLD